MSRTSPFDPRAFLQARNQGRVAPAPATASPASPQILGVDSDDDFSNLNSSFATLASVSPSPLAERSEINASPRQPSASPATSNAHRDPSPSSGSAISYDPAVNSSQDRTVNISLPPGHTGHQTPSEVVQNQLFTGYAVPPRLPAALGRHSGAVPPPSGRRTGPPARPRPSIPPRRSPPPTYTAAVAAAPSTRPQAQPRPSRPPLPIVQPQSAPVPARPQFVEMEPEIIARPDAVVAGQMAPKPPRRPPNPIRRQAFPEQVPPRLACPPIRPQYQERGPSVSGRPSYAPSLQAPGAVLLGPPRPPAAPDRSRLHQDQVGPKLTRPPAVLAGPAVAYRPAITRRVPPPGRPQRPMIPVIRRPAAPVSIQPRSAAVVPPPSLAVVTLSDESERSDAANIDQQHQELTRSEDHSDEFNRYRSPSPLSLPAQSQPYRASPARGLIPQRTIIPTTTASVLFSSSEVEQFPVAEEDTPHDVGSIPFHTRADQIEPKASPVSSHPNLNQGSAVARISHSASPISRQTTATRLSPPAASRETQPDRHDQQIRSRFRSREAESPNRLNSRDRSTDSHATWFDRGSRRISPLPLVGSISDEKRQCLLERARLLSQRHQEEIDALKQQIQKLKASQRTIPIPETAVSDSVVAYDDCLPYAFGENSRLVRRVLEDQLDNNARMEAMLSKVSFILESGFYPKTFHDQIMKTSESRDLKIAEERLASAEIRIQDLIKENEYLSKQVAAKEERIKSVQEESRVLIDTLRQSLEQETFERKRMNTLYDEERHVLNASLRETIQNLAADNERFRVRLADAGLPDD